MAKPIIKFSAVPYQIGTGTETKTGYRPQLEAQAGLFDLPFCREVVNEKRLQTSPDELLHEMEMVAEVATSKVAEDGRPRGITKLIKWNRFAKGNLESPTSPWNESCKAEIRPQLLADASKIVDASFQNVNEGIGVRLNYVAWVGAQTVTNVVKIGKAFAAYGNHMEWLSGDTATLTVGTTAYSLTCTESDVAHAVFSWPAGLSPEAGTTAEFVMKSRGGIEDGQVYTSKKTVTILAGDPPEPTVTTITGMSQTGQPANTAVLAANSPVTITGTKLLLGSEDFIGIRLYDNDGVQLDIGMLNGKVTENTNSTIKLSGFQTNGGATNEQWIAGKTYLFLDMHGTEVTLPIAFVGE